MGVRKSNARLMTFIAETRDISAVDDPRTNKGHKVDVPHGSMVIRLPTSIATHILNTFPGDAGMPNVEAANKLFKYPEKAPPPNLPPPPEDMDLDAAARSPVKQAR